MLMIPKSNGPVVTKEDSFALKDGFSIHIGTFNQEIVDVFLTRMREHFQINGTVSGSIQDVDIILSLDEEADREAYHLEIDGQGIRLAAKDDAGMTWALGTLIHLTAEATAKNEGVLPHTTLRDWPQYKYRGLMVDVCRHFFDIDQMKRIIEEMSLFKLNVLHWHLTEDQGWRIESKVFPKLHEVGGRGQYYTQEQIQEIVRFATARGIEVIPEINMPGHSSAAISSYPHLGCFDEQIQVADKAGIFKTIICAGKESTYEWIYQLMDEVTALFPSNRIHLGGDEAPKEKWNQCPHCIAFMKENGIPNSEELQGVFTGKVAAYLRAKGKEVICWNDSLKSEELAKDITAQYWMEISQDSYVYPHFEKGRKMIFSETFHAYFDYPYCVVPLKKTYEYSPEIRQHTGLQGDNVLGIEGCIWTERVPSSDVLEAMISPRIQALAEAAWTIDRSYDDFLIRLQAQMSEFGLIGLASTPFVQATIEGEEAKAQAIGFLQSFMGAISSSDIEMGFTPEEMQGMMTLFITNIFDEQTAGEILKSLQH
ncbi:beta-N-acetylhexosaminidase [Paenibacillus sp. OV219]|uniref:beta-N-acetylhexosaminidase n=1 Tax=Paenibacillus sp. OV219 TaxID=1884377 RepID=UPI0008C768B9|nr:beta-N-acetylhexosaminidase [Paenibacillus sp. OV219]SEM56119.1 hexosaminidase [Paenibacillus sp. OV219]